jgi:hypothetical protein
VLDTKPYADEAHRSWIFRTVGYGHDLKFWKDLVSNLRLVGYDYVLSMEHEDSLMSLREGLEKGVGALRELVLTDERGKPARVDTLGRSGFSSNRFAQGRPAPSFGSALFC